jgi:CheY-like chemotaxis protein
MMAFGSIYKLININMKTKILYIDDDRFLLNMYKIKFEKNGNYEVVTMEKLGPDYITEIANISPDIILSDHVRPKPDGIEVLKALKADERTKNIPFVFLTNTITPKLIEESKKEGVLGIINKGKTIPAEVVEEVAKILAGPVKSIQIVEKRNSKYLLKFLPDALFLLGVFILSCSLFRQPVRVNGLPKLPSTSHINYFTEYKVLGVMLIALSIVIGIRYYIKKK